MRMWWVALAMVVGCGALGEEGDACESDDECEDGLHCHIEEGAGECEDDHEHEDEEKEEA